MEKGLKGGMYVSLFGLSRGEYGLIIAKRLAKVDTPVDEGFPEVGFEFNFMYEFIEGWEGLGGAGKGWEDGDNLKVVHHDPNGGVVVLNIQSDVLNSAHFINNTIFKKPPSEEEILIEEITKIMDQTINNSENLADVYCDGKVFGSKLFAKALVEAGFVMRSKV